MAVLEDTIIELENVVNTLERVYDTLGEYCHVNNTKLDACVFVDIFDAMDEIESAIKKLKEKMRL